MDYRYLLYFERSAQTDVLERLGEIAAPANDGPTTLVLPDRTVELPFPPWIDTGSTIRWDDPDPTWEFMTTLCFEPDEEIEDYLDRLRFTPTEGDPFHDERGRAQIGIIYLTVHRDPDDWALHGSRDVVLFEFGTPGSSMSVLFWESGSIRRTFVALLEACRGVCGLLDMEDMGADLLWLRGHDRDVRLPTWELSVEEIERSAGPWAPPQASFAVEQLVAGAKAARRRTGGELGRNHWLVALARGGHTVPGPAGGTDPEAAARRLQAQLDLGTLGAPLPEDVVREQAAASARRAGRALVTVEDLVAAVAE